MGSSLLTNRASMTALQTLKAVGDNMESTQNRISTGRRINEAADNVAYWAISNGMRSDSQTTSVIKDALHLGKARVDQAYTANQEVKKQLQEIKDLVISAHGMTVDDQKKIEASIRTKLANIVTAVSSGALNGANLLAQDGKTAIDIPASFRRDGDKVMVDKISLDPKALQLVDSSGGVLNFASGGILAPIFEGDPAKKAQAGKTDDDKKNDQNIVSPSAFSALFHVGTTGALTTDEIDAIATKVQKVLNAVESVDTVLGAAKKQVDSQYDFVGKLIDNLDKSVGTLVDADMNAESARLSALQVQQQLAVQALSIANQSSQSLLTLFRQ